jgi:plastocyanin
MGRPRSSLASLLVCALLALATAAASALGDGSHMSSPASAQSHRCPKGKRLVRVHHHQRCVAAHRSSASRPRTLAGPGMELSSPAPGPALPSQSAASTPAESSTPVSGPEPGPGPGSPGETPDEPPSVAHVQVTSVEYHYTLSRTSVPAGKVVFQFVNDGMDEHNLNVDSAAGASEGSFPNTLSKGVATQTLTLKHGSYTLFCSLPEHEAKGMKATLTVE